MVMLIIASEKEEGKDVVRQAAFEQHLLFQRFFSYFLKNEAICLGIALRFSGKT